jgi:hypothetical protein
LGVEAGPAAEDAAVCWLPKLNEVDEVAVPAGAAAAVDFGAPKLNPEGAVAAVVAGAVVVVDDAAPEVGVLPNSGLPAGGGAAAGVVPNKPGLGASAPVAGVEDCAC